METPEAPRDSAAARTGRAAEARGREAARWAGRGDEERGLSRLELAVAAAAFVCLFLPWLGFAGRTQAGWSLPLGIEYGLLSLTVVLVQLLSLAPAWSSRGSRLLTFCLTAGTGVTGVSSVANLRWGGLLGNGFSEFEYGAWLGLAFAVLLILLAALRFVTLGGSDL